MRNTSKKLLAMLLAGTMSLTLLTACGSAKTAQSSTVVDQIVVRIDKAYFVADLMTKGGALLNAYHVTLGVLQSLVYSRNQGLGLTGALYANK